MKLSRGIVEGLQPSSINGDRSPKTGDWRPEIGDRKIEKTIACWDYLKAAKIDNHHNEHILGMRIHADSERISEKGLFDFKAGYYPKEQRKGDHTRFQIVCDPMKEILSEFI